MNEKVPNLTQFDSLASSTSAYIASVAAASSTAILSLAQAVNQNAIIIGTQTEEPDANSYWFYIEEVED